MKNKTQKILKSDLASIYPKVCDSWKKTIAEYLVEFVNDKYIEVDNSVILKAHKAADSGQRSLIEKYFDVSIINLLSFNTYSKVCKELGEKELLVGDFSFLPLERRIKALNQAKIQQLEKFFNEGWVPNWKDQSENKYYPYFTLNSSGGLGFDGSSYRRSGFSAVAGFYKDQETSDFIGRNFIDIYEGLK